MANKGYAGKIKNTGAQKVQAPFAQSKSGGKNVVKNGDDLRSGK